MSPDPGGAPAENRFGAALGRALAGGAIGGVAVLFLSIVLDVWILFLAHPLFALWLVLSGLIAALTIALLARCSARRLSALAILIASAVATAVLFSALPLYFVLFGPDRAGGLLLG